MKKHSKILYEAVQKFTSKEVEEFLLPIINDEKEFEWDVVCDDMVTGLASGTGDFFTCIEKAEKDAHQFRRGLGPVGIVLLNFDKYGNYIAMKYDPKTRKWSFADMEI